MTPEEFRAAGHRLIDWIADYRAGLVSIKDCLVVISNREAELANTQSLNRNERPHYTDETPNAHVVKISSIPKKPH